LLFDSITARSRSRVALAAHGFIEDFLGDDFG
jgi:hypothetical protein